MIVSPRSAARPRRRFGTWAWVGAVAVHAGIFAVLQFGGEPARSSMPLPPASEAIRVQAMDAEILRQRRAAHQQALRQLEQARQREAQAKEKERLRQQALREAAERKRRDARRRAQREAEREAERRRAAAAKKRQEAAAAKATAMRAEAERQAQVLQEKLAQAARVASQRRAARLQQQRREAERRSRLLGEWTLAIRTHIESRWRQPPAAASQPCEAVVEQDRRGAVLSVDVRNCAASKAWQDSLRNAVLKASPLPAAPHKQLFERRLVITFHPRERD